MLIKLAIEPKRGFIATNRMARTTMTAVSPMPWNSQRRSACPIELSVSTKLIMGIAALLEPAESDELDDLVPGCRNRVHQPDKPPVLHDGDSVG